MPEAEEIPSQTPERLNLTQDVFIMQTDWGWMSAFKTDSAQEHPRILAVGKDGTIGPKGFDEDWGYDNPNFRKLYQDTKEALKLQGIELQPPQPQFPQTEAFIAQISKEGQNEIDLETYNPDSDIVLLVGNKAHPNFKKEDNIAYVGKVAYIFKTKTENGIETTVQFKKNPEPTALIDEYAGWQLLYEHFTPDEEHITHPHRGDIKSATAVKDEGSQPSLRAFKVDETFLRTVANETEPYAGLRNNPFRRDAGHDSVTGGIAEIFEQIEFEEGWKESSR